MAAVLRWETFRATPRSAIRAAAKHQGMCYSQRPDVKIQHIDGEILLLDDQNGYIHQLNQTAGFVWRQCDGVSTRADIAQRLVQEFEVEDGVAFRDVSEVIEKLRELKLLEE